MLFVRGSPPRKAPELGEHADAILEELGFDTVQIEALHASGAASEAKGRVPGARASSMTIHT